MGIHEGIHFTNTFIALVVLVLSFVVGMTGHITLNVQMDLKKVTLDLKSRNTALFFLATLPPRCLGSSHNENHL